MPNRCCRALTVLQLVWYNFAQMNHRHLEESDDYSLAVIDDIIDRGNREDWLRLKSLADANPAFINKILRICAVKVSDPYAQRYHLWNYYAKHAVA